MIERLILWAETELGLAAMTLGTLAAVLVAIEWWQL